MKKIFFTGGTGFIGRNLLPLLKEKYEVYAPTRQELDLKESGNLEQYIKNGQFDVIIHAAIPNITYNKEDKKETLYSDSIRTFLKLYQLQDYYGKMLYFGSGAEYDKSRPIADVSENDIGISIPIDDYGLAKYVMNELCRQSKNIYNLRIFGCYGPTDAPFKLISYVISCCLQQQDVQLHQNCYFDFMYVTDIAKVLDAFIEQNPAYHDYNICTGIRWDLASISKIIMNLLNCHLPVTFEKEGFNHEYTGTNKRLLEEFADLTFTSLEDGIKKQIAYVKEGKYEKTSS